MIYCQSKKVANRVFEEGKILTDKFNEHVVEQLLREIARFREALIDCERDAKNPQNSLLMLQNFTRLVQISYQAYQKLTSANYTEALVAIRESFKNIQEEMNRPSPKKGRGYKPLEIDYFR